MIVKGQLSLRKFEVSTTLFKCELVGPLSILVISNGVLVHRPILGNQSLTGMGRDSNLAVMVMKYKIQPFHFRVKSNVEISTF